MPTNAPLPSPSFFGKPRGRRSVSMRITQVAQWLIFSFRKPLKISSHFLAFRKSDLRKIPQDLGKIS
jgi:hypothetical protein